jgi:hypothetical protein
MSGRQSAATDEGLRLIAQGVPQSKAAAQVGVSPSTLDRARKRAGLPALKPGRPERPDATTPLPKRR